MRLSEHYKHGWCPECYEEVEHKPGAHEHEYFCKKCNKYHNVENIHTEKPKARVVENGCPVCHTTVKGTKESKYYCPRCNVLFEEHQVKAHPVQIIREEPNYDKPIIRRKGATIDVPDIDLPEEQKIQFLDNKCGKVALTKVVRQKGYLYFIDKIGDVSKVKMARSRADKGPRVHFKVLKVGLTKEKGYLYYLDTDGDIARSPMKRFGE